MAHSLDSDGTRYLVLQDIDISGKMNIGENIRREYGQFHCRALCVDQKTGKFGIYEKIGIIDRDGVINKDPGGGPNIATLQDGRIFYSSLECLTV
jgi:hypothetical protein